VNLPAVPRDPDPWEGSSECVTELHPPQCGAHPRWQCLFGVSDQLKADPPTPFGDENLPHLRNINEHLVNDQQVTFVVRAQVLPQQRYGRHRGRGTKGCSPNSWIGPLRVPPPGTPPGNAHTWPTNSQC
jgi:hypothetical protein